MSEAFRHRIRDQVRKWFEAAESRAEVALLLDAGGIGIPRTRTGERSETSTSFKGAERDGEPDISFERMVLAAVMIRPTRRQQRTSKLFEAYFDRASALFGWSDEERPEGRRSLRVALVEIRRALLLDPDDYDCLVLAGHICAALDGDELVAKALHYYDRAIELGPENSAAYDAKSSMLMYFVQSPEGPEAERLARKSVELARRYHEDIDMLELRYVGLLDVLEARGKFKELRWTARRALKDCPTEFMRSFAEDYLKRAEAEESPPDKSGIRS